MKNKRSMAEHMKRKHPNEIPRCLDCNLLFYCTNSYEMHMAQKHKEKVYPILKVPSNFDEEQVKIPYEEKA